VTLAAEVWEGVLQSVSKTRQRRNGKGAEILDLEAAQDDPALPSPFWCMSRTCQMGAGTETRQAEYVDHDARTICDSRRHR